MCKRKSLKGPQLLLILSTSSLLWTLFTLIMVFVPLVFPYYSILLPLSRFPTLSQSRFINVGTIPSLSTATWPASCQVLWHTSPSLDPFDQWGMVENWTYVLFISYPSPPLISCTSLPMVDLDRFGDVLTSTLETTGLSLYLTDFIQPWGISWAQKGRDV